MRQSELVVLLIQFSPVCLLSLAVWVREDWCPDVYFFLSRTLPSVHKRFSSDTFHLRNLVKMLFLVFVYLSQVS